MGYLFRRLRARKLGQWMLAYLAGAFVTVQIMDALEGALALSQRVQLTVLAVLVTGFAATAVVAWYHGEKGRQAVTIPELLALALVVVLGGAGTSLLWIGDPPRQAHAEAPATVPDTTRVRVVGEGSADDTPPVAVARPTPNSRRSPVQDRPEPAVARSLEGAASELERAQVDFRVTPSEATLGVGDSVRIAVEGEGPIRVRWESRDPSVALVSSDGLVLGIAPGFAEITASSREDQFTTRVTVTSARVASLRILPLGRLRIGDVVEPTLITQLSDGRIDSARVAAWSSTDPRVLEVGPRGRTLIRGAGAAALVAVIDSVVDSLEVVVAPARVRDVRERSVPTIAVLGQALEAYRRALEAGDIDAVRVAYPGISARQISGWETLFGLGDIVVHFSDITVRAVTPDAATLEFEQTVNGERVEANVTRFEATLVAPEGTWRIQRLVSL